jgi:catechol 2,3-dioxygenase-like lactoylglutathione lyase family enzyme
MSLSHLTLPTRDVNATTSFLEKTFGYARIQRPGNSPVETLWLDIGRGQQIHVVYVDGFATSPFEGEFGRHIAVFHPLTDFQALKERLTQAGGVLIAEIRPVTFERFFFREPVNGYVFEVVDQARAENG